MSIQTVTAAAAYPLDLAEAKAHLRVPYATEDALITAWLAAARDYAEQITKKSLVVARYKQVLDGFPGQAVTGIVYGKPYARPGNAIYLERGPVLDVASIQYIEIGSGLTKTVGVDDSVQYTVDYASDPVRITPVFGQIWPIPQPQIGAVWVNFDAGYAAKITADHTTGQITFVGTWPALSVGNTVRFANSGGALPGGLAPMTDYYIKSVVSAGVYTISATNGGAQQTFTDNGSGTNYGASTNSGTGSSGIPDGLNAWLKLRLGALNENREEISETPVITTLPFADRLLDGYRTWEF